MSTKMECWLSRSTRQPSRQGDIMSHLGILELALIDLDIYNSTRFLGNCHGESRQRMLAKSDLGSAQLDKRCSLINDPNNRKSKNHQRHSVEGAASVVLHATWRTSMFLDYMSAVRAAQLLNSRNIRLRFGVEQVLAWQGSSHRYVYVVALLK